MIDVKSTDRLCIRCRSHRHGQDLLDALVRLYGRAGHFDY